MAVLIGATVFNQVFGAVAKTSVAGAANRLDLMAFVPMRSFSVSEFQIDVVTAVAATNARILMYSDNSGVPNTKLIESTNLDCSTTGLKTYTASYTFTAGTTYWVGVHTSSTQTLRAIPLANLINLGTPNATGATHYSLYRSTPAFGSAPATYSGGTLTSAIGPEVRFLTS